MKKAIAIAIGLVALATITTFWFAGEQTDSDQQATPVANIQEPAPPTADEPASEPAVEVVPFNVSSNRAPDLNAGPAALFRNPVQFGDDFRAAAEQASKLNDGGGPFGHRRVLTEVRVVEIDKDTFSKFFDAVITNDVSTATSGEGVNLTLFSNVPCTLSSFLRVESPEASWQFQSTCVENDAISA
jgi:hypothetical protein